MPTVIERPKAVTMKGNPLTLVGPRLEPGDKAPDFRVVDQAWSPVTLASTGSRVRVFSVVPSLDTGICSAQTKRVNDAAARLKDTVGFYSISTDLPFAQKRWCSEAAVDLVTTLSDHIETSFGQAYGTLVKEMRIESRAIFILDAQGVIRYVEYVPEIAQHPDYDAALAALAKLV